MDHNINDTVTAAGTFLALGNAATSTEESYADAVQSRHRGRALAVVRGGRTRDGHSHRRVETTRHLSLDLLSNPVRTSTNYTQDALA